MKILIVITSTGWAGLEMNLIKLARMLSDQKHEIHFATLKNSRFDREIQKDFSQKVTLDKTKKYFDFASAKSLNNYVRTHDIKLILNTYRKDIDLTAWMKFFNKNLKIIHLQQMQIGISKKGLFQKFRYKAIDLWITPLNFLKQEVLEKTVVNQSKIAVIPFSLDTQRFSKNKISRESAQEFFQIKTTNTLLGIIGRFDEKKGQLFVVEAVKKLLEEGKNIELLLVGEPTIDDPKSLSYYKKIEKVISENQLQDKIHIRTFTNQIEKFYKAIDLFIMASEAETYGLVTIEAMLSGTPVIGTNSGGTPEVLENGKFGGLFEVNNYQSFRNQFEKFETQKQNNQNLLTEITNACIEKYSLHKEIKSVIQQLNQL